MLKKSKLSKKSAGQAAERQSPRTSTGPGNQELLDQLAERTTSRTEAKAVLPRQDTAGIDFSGAAPFGLSGNKGDDNDHFDGPVRSALEWTLGYEENSLRSQLNGAPPTHDEAEASGWTQLPESMVGDHDDGEGAPEEKWLGDGPLNLGIGGPEVVYDGDDQSVMTEQPYAGTYNFVHPIAPSLDDFKDKPLRHSMEVAGSNLGHFALDVVPYLATDPSRLGDMLGE